jgi:hypothetical protein
MNERAARRLRAVLIPVAVLLFASAAVAQAKKPRAVYDATSHDFGKVKQGEVVTHEFVFKNEGEAVLVIEKVETTCGCTAALVSEKKIDPGREGRLKTTFDTRGYSGRLSRYVYVVSNDGEDPRREIRLSAEIEVPPSPRIDLDRYNVDMGLCLEGETPTARIVIKSVGQRELKVEAAHESARFFSGGKPLASPFLLPVGESREIEIRFPPQTRPGTQRDYILLKSNDPVRSTLSIYVSRYVITRKELKELFDKYGKVLKKSD